MKNFVLLLISAAVLVNSQSPLQIDPEASIVKHSHDSGETKTFSGQVKIRLPKNVLPISYELRITPILDVLPTVPSIPQFTAPGTVRIFVKCHAATNVILLHKHEILKIGDATLTVKGITDPAETFTPTSSVEPAQELYRITLDNPLKVGNVYEIYVEFAAPVSTDRFNGLYLSQYIEPATGDKRYLAATQFEAASARQAFPCFDEPAIKAKFQVTIGYDSTKYIALGNSQELPGDVPEQIPDFPVGWVYKKFEETEVPMSAYLVAIVVADYTFTSASKDLYPKETRIYGSKHLMQDAAGQPTGGVYSAEKSARLLTFFEEHYGIGYHLPKMDSVGLIDFNFGAMENWGLNIYRQDYLLFHEGFSLETDRKRITSVLSHELVHQWFGNMVTCEWWSYIWLNEGFATYNEYVGAHAVNTGTPEDYEFDKVRINEMLQVALLYDALPSTHPLVNAAHPDEPNDELMVYFSRITYQKGGAVIFMMEGFLGKDTLNKGLRNYLDGMKFQGATQDDLFRFLTTQAHLDGKLSLDITMKDIMDTWTLQSGFPLIRVNKAGSSRIYISQERFVNGGTVYNGNQLDPNDLWHVPLAITTADAPDFSNHSPKIWLEKNILLKSTSVDTTKWVIVNPDATGYYRVLYDTSLTNLIVEQLQANHEVISELSRSQLFDDYFTLAAQKYIQLETALQFTKYIATESKIVVWTTILTQLRPILNKLSGTSAAFAPFKNYILPKIITALEAIGKEQSPGEKGWKVILRSNFLDWACALDHTECRDYATKLFNDWHTDPVANPIPSDIRNVVYCGAVSSGGAAAYENVKQRYIENKDKGDDGQLVGSIKFRTSLLSGMACTEEVAVADALLADILDTSPTGFIHLDDKGTLLERLAANAQIRPRVITFLRTDSNLVELISLLEPPRTARVLMSLSNYVGTQQEHTDISELIDPKYDANWGGQLANVKAYVQTIGANVAWRTEHDERLKEWFTANK